jgi:acyl-CoA synthetase (AMP-forming)/AMP-acid ligase II
MLGLMQDWPLLIHRVIDHAAGQHGGRDVVSRSVEGPIHRTTYAAIRTRALQVAKRLEREGIALGDRVGTLAWNTWRHLELWYGISGLGAVYHTVNPRLFPDQIAYIVTHGGDRLLFLDLTFVPLVEALADRLPAVERFIILTDGQHLPQTTLRGAVAYEDWLAEVDDDFAWRTFDENTAAGLCYTSGTTGHPKGVLYSHRSNVLHALQILPVDNFALSSRQRVLAIVPLFHANSWSLAFSAPMAGAALVLPGPRLDGASIYELIESEAVSFSAGVPTIWLGLLAHLDKTGAKLSSLKRVAIGGSACPQAMIEAFETRHGVDVLHAWGMTEMSPVGTTGAIKSELEDLPSAALFALKAKQGWPLFGVEMKITDDQGDRLPHDGQTFGRLKVRGVAVAARYFKDEGGDILDEDGYFDTGDVATIDAHGYMAITDRAKDVIKSGGEWISSIELENHAIGHPDVAEAAVIGVAHPRWDERPLLIIVPKPGTAPTRDALLRHLASRVAKWWLPDDVVFVDDIPHTATGKIQKTALRDRFRDYRFPSL